MKSNVGRNYLKLGFKSGVGLNGMQQPIDGREMVTNILTEEKIKEVAGKIWRNQGMAAYFVTVVNGTITKVQRSKRNSGQRTFEGKVKSLKNLRAYRKKSRAGLKGSVEEINITGFLSPEEEEFYNLRKQQYLKDFPDLNDSSDAAVLHEILSAELTIRRLNHWMSDLNQKRLNGGNAVARQAQQKDMQGLTKSMKDAQAALHQALDKLGATRKSRMAKGDDGQGDDIAALSEIFGDDDAIKLIMGESNELKGEEKDQVEAKKQRDAELGIHRGAIEAMDLENIMGDLDLQNQQDG